MSTAYSDILACAQRIIEAVGISPAGGKRLTLSGRIPYLPATPLSDLMSRPAYEQLEDTVRTQLAGIVLSKLSVLRDRSISRFQEMCGRLHSASHSGLLDIDVETRLIQAVETRYHRCIDDIRTLLARVLAQQSCSQPDNRNTRGGFGDVSPPNHSS